jgi:hypothetical protein
MFNINLPPISKFNHLPKDFNLAKPKIELFSQNFMNSIKLDPRDVRIRIPF